LYSVFDAEFEKNYYQKLERSMKPRILYTLKKMCSFEKMTSAEYFEFFDRKEVFAEAKK
jgi:hypothetical protein